MTMRWLDRPPQPSDLAGRSSRSWLRSTRLCAEALAGIADPLFPALTTARRDTPAAAARAALGLLAGCLESPEPEGDPPAWLLPHQADAVRRARGILDRFGGVLIADGVGLGKTWIALGLAALEREAGGDAIAIVPAPLREEWRRMAATAGATISVFSHTDLARRKPGLLPRCTLLLVDEAHAFRNPRTHRYDTLARLAAGRRLALLTATPFNNSPADLAALVALFAARDRFREFGIGDLPVALRRRDPQASLVLGALSVCRTRRLVEARFPELRGSFPARRLEPPIRYDLDAVYQGRLAELLAALADLLGAQAGRESASALMHLGLLRRLESSRAALRRSLRRQRDFLAEVERAGGDGVALTRAAYRAAVPRGDDDDAQLVFWSLVARRGNGPARLPDVPAARAAVERALALAAAPQPSSRVSEWTPAPDDADPKTRALADMLQGPLAGQKTIVFTEYRDTALELLRHLRRRLRVVAVAGDRAWLGTTAVTRQEALDAFAPAARGRRAEALLLADVLIATDVAGEGLNLQDAQAVVNYDLPWNPVRVMQRVGRIDRLGSPHREIRVLHMLPSGGWTDLGGVLRRLRAKLDAAEHGPGAEPDPLATLWWVDRGPLTPGAVEEESWRRVSAFEARERWRALAGPRQAGTRPIVAAGVANDGETPAAAVMLALRWPGGLRLPLPFVAAPGMPPRLDPGAFGDLAERALVAHPIPAEPALFATLLAGALPLARAAAVACSAARHGTDDPSPGRQQALALLRRQAAEAARARADARTLDGALRLLEEELPAGLDRLVGRLAAGPAGPHFAARVVELVAGARPPASERPAGAPRVEFVAAFVLAARCPSGDGAERFAAA